MSTSTATVAHYQGVELEARVTKLEADKLELRSAVRHAINYINIEGTPPGRKAVALLMDILELTR